MRVDPPIRFYAGMPLFSAEGNPLGMMSIIDTIPRLLTPEQEHALRVLGRQAAARLELRAQRRLLEEVLKEKEKVAAGLQASEELFRAFMNASPFLSYIKDAAGRLLFYNRSFAQRFGVSEYAWLGRTDEQLWSRNLTKSVRHPRSRGHGRRPDRRDRGTHPEADGTISSLRSFKFPCHDSAGNVLLAGVAVDVSEEVAHKAELERYHQNLRKPTINSAAWLSQTNSLACATAVPSRSVSSWSSPWRAAASASSPSC